MSKELIEKLRDDGKFLGGNFGKLMHEAADALEAKAAPVADPDCDRSACGDFSSGPCDNPDCPALRSNKAAPVGERESVTVLPDGSAFGVVSFPLPRDHWLYAEREYDDGADQPKELWAPILTHELRSAVEAAVRYAVRGATDCGRESDFDPDALVQNAVYALCGPFGAAHQRQQAREVVMPDVVEFAVARWEAEVKHRPLVNVHRRALDGTWRQIIRFAGGDPDHLCGPDHDTLIVRLNKGASSHE